MNSSSNSPRGYRAVASRRKHLAACLAAALGLGGLATQAIAATDTVKVCSDSDIYHPPLLLLGLRSTVAGANDGDTIDMTALSNCTITLTAGEIPITVNNLLFTGPTSQNVTIDAHKASRIFDHTGTGGVTLSYVSLKNGYSDPPDTPTRVGFGGCVFSKGSLDLEHSTVSACEAAYGSAIYAAGNVSLTRSVVTGNNAYRTDGYPDNLPATIYLHGTLLAKYSQINSNNGSGIYGRGNITLDNTTVNGNSYGGVSAQGYVTLNASIIDSNAGVGINGFGAVTVNGSTISNNKSNFPDGGGISVSAKAGTLATTLTITNSTISGNSVSNQGGGIYAYNTQIKISNSTIAYNAAAVGGGIYATSCSNSTIQSSIIADNSVAAGNNQFYSDAHLGLCTLSGSNNLVGVLSFPLFGALTGPAGLTPLAYHGGAVKTHALLATSPAIGKGNNLLNLATDERGTGFPRVVGAAIDIGAYERQANDDEIFYNGFQQEP